MFKRLKRSLYIWSSIFIGLVVIGLIVVIQLFLYYGKDLPDYHQLEQYDPPSITRLYTSDGHILDEFATENRIYIKYAEIPQEIINAFVAAEDKNFFKHEGVDPLSIFRAAVTNILNIGRHKSPVGGSTITQQVVKNFLLTNERSFSRKIKEAVLSYRISKVYSKQKVMELYLNQIYLGNNSYGIASAALNYFNKELKDLNIEEIALLAALPKAPSYMNPVRNYARAKERRDWVLGRMFEEAYITDEEYHRGINTAIVLQKRHNTDFFRSDYYSEAVRQELIARFGEDAVYNEGLQVYTNVDEKLQRTAEDALRNGLLRYDKNHGWRGALGAIDLTQKDWLQKFKDFPKPLDIGSFQLAIVLKQSTTSVVVVLNEEKKGTIKLEKMLWARKNLKEQTLGGVVKSTFEVVKEGDVILVKPVEGTKNEYSLEQIPNINGAIVVLETHSGRVLAEVGGYSYNKSNFNRATQADRQPGSAFKSFIYLAALEKGFDPRSIVYDQPLQLSQGPALPMWAPKNFKSDFLGPITLRKSLEKSRNVSTVWLLTKIGLAPVVELSERLGIYDKPPNNYSMALGAFETKVTNLTNAYNMIASGGKRTELCFIERVYDRKGKLIYSADNSKIVSPSNTISTSIPPQLAYTYDQVIDEDINYQMLSMLEGAVQRGTGYSARVVQKTLAGKTGTTNDSFDTWFIGFSPDIVAGIYVGFDNPRTVGQKESGATLALPIFIDFMKETLKDISDRKFKVPDGIELINIDKNTGEAASYETNPQDVIVEAIRKNPFKNRPISLEEIIDVLHGKQKTSESPSHRDEGFGGMY